MRDKVSNPIPVMASMRRLEPVREISVVLDRTVRIGGDRYTDFCHDFSYMKKFNHRPIDLRRDFRDKFAHLAWGEDKGWPNPPSRTTRPYYHRLTSGERRRWALGLKVQGASVAGT